MNVSCMKHYGNVGKSISSCTLNSKQRAEFTALCDAIGSFNEFFFSI